MKLKALLASGRFMLAAGTTAAATGLVMATVNHGQVIEMQKLAKHFVASPTGARESTCLSRDFHQATKYAEAEQKATFSAKDEKGGLPQVSSMATDASLVR
jgi:hypothetical protein